MSSLSPAGRSAAARKNVRVPLCLFTFVDGRRCRTPRISSHPHFCYYHAQKEARARATEKLGKDLAYFFSGDYLSACDLSTALSRLIPAVIRGDIKPRLARTVAYMFQTQLQAIHLSQHEYINAFGSDGWRKAVRNSVNSNGDYLFPPKSDDNVDPDAEPAAPTPVGAGLARPDSDAAQPATAPTPQPRNASQPSPATVEAALSVARELFPSRPNSTPAQSAPTVACHPECSEGPCLDPAPSTADETRLASAPAQSTQPNNAPPPAPPCPQPRPTTPNHDHYAVHFDHNYRLRIDGKLF